MVTDLKIISNSEEDTKKIAKKIAPLFHAGDLILLEGDLGAGKTCFVKGFTDGRHSKDLVNSPTFSIANFYQSNILHIDLYRISNMDEFIDLGLFDYFAQSITLIEWGKKFAPCFEHFLTVSFEINNDNTRLLTFSSQGVIYDSKMNSLQEALKVLLLC